MAEEQKPASKQAPTNEQKPSITLDPSKFSINDDGQVIIVDPAFAEALRTAVSEETDDDNNGHGVMVGVIVSF